MPVMDFFCHDGRCVDNETHTFCTVKSLALQ
jgi:hypothetical protein